MVVVCWHHFNKAYGEEKTIDIAYSGYNGGTNQYANSGATNDINEKSKKPTTHDKFGGKDQVHATNDICTKVNHVGRQSIICTLKHIFIINSILHIPQAK